MGKKKTKAKKNAPPKGLKKISVDDSQGSLYSGADQDESNLSL